MLGVFREKAYAKVNFNLKVLPKREDGFHPIESIFQTVNLFDELIVTEKESDGCEVECSSLKLPAKNTITMAYQAFCETVNCKVPGIKVVLQKGIPSGGGLGGGSSDAATLIRILEKMCGITLSDLQLDYIASKTGSDVFFFMNCDSEGKGCALVSGRGEIVKKIESRQDLFLLLIFPDVSSSTKEAYSLVDELLKLENKVKYPSFEELQFVYMQPPQKWVFNNTFTQPLVNTYSKIGEALSDLRKTEALFTDMSGSGSTVFGVFTLKQQAIYYCNLLAETWKCKVVETF